MLSSRRACRPRFAFAFHLGAQRLDEMRGVRRERRAALDGDEGLEARRLLDLEQSYAGNAVIRHRELVDDGNPKSDLRIGRVDADQGKARHFGGRDPLATGERVILRHDAEQAAGGQRQEIQRGMI